MRPLSKLHIYTCPNCGYEGVRFPKRPPPKTVDWVLAEDFRRLVEPYLTKHPVTSGYARTINGVHIHKRNSVGWSWAKLFQGTHTRMRTTTAENLLASVNLPPNMVNEILIQD